MRQQSLVPSGRQAATKPLVLRISCSAPLPAAQQQNALLFRAVELLFRFPPFFAFAVARVRSLHCAPAASCAHGYQLCRKTCRAGG